MADPKIKPYRYSGNDGYLFPGLGALSTGDVVKLTADQADELGDDFQPDKGTTAAPAAVPEGATP